MSLIIALPRESRTSERRVALDPSRVERLQQQGLQVRIEADCGHAASFHDEDYHGVSVMDSFADVVRGADIVVKVVCPTLEEIALLPKESVLICIMSAFQHLAEIAALRDRRITVLAMDHLPRTTRAQPMDALSSQATVAGYKAALLAAELSPRLFPMLTTAAGTIRPSRVLVIGAGVAGLQAIATSRRLGAQVEAYDIRRAAKEQIESLGARMVDTGVEVEGAGGVARALRKDEKQKQHDVLAEHLARAHVVICAASIPGRRAPRIITEDMVDGMLPESVIVDMAASTGGNCELTRIGEHYYYNDTLIVGPLNLPSHGAVHASEMYARNIYNMLQLIIVDNRLTLNRDDEIIAGCVLLHDGKVSHPATAAQLDAEQEPFSDTARRPAELPDQTAGWLDIDTEVPAGTDDSSETGSTPTSLRGAPSTGRVREQPDVGESREPEPADQQGSSSFGQSGQSGQATGSATFAVGSVGGDSPVSAATHADPENADPEKGASGAVPAPGRSESAAAMRDPESRGHGNVLDDTRQADSGPGGDDEPETELLPRDDLTLIAGVGPALQERLYSFGYRQFHQLAELDDDAIEKLSVQLELREEIREQDWPAQARRLMETVR